MVNKETEGLYPIIVFDDSSLDIIYKALALRKNENDELIDEKGKILTNQNFEKIKSSNFGGILMGSKIPITKNKLELVEYFVRKK